MKKLIFILAAAITLVSCSKSAIEQAEVVPEYLGVYNNTSNGDTVYVSQNGNYLKFDWRRSTGLIPFVFDSVVVNTDLTFTDNEWVTIAWPLPAYTTFSNIGSGKFGTNTLQFIFVANGATINYNGIKKN